MFPQSAFITADIHVCLQRGLSMFARLVHNRRTIPNVPIYNCNDEIYKHWASAHGILFSLRNATSFRVQSAAERFYFPRAGVRAR